jgi:hypothetical protein
VIVNVFDSALDRLAEEGEWGQVFMGRSMAEGD